ncbi:MAG: PilZ domain-containing protein [Oscillospiraceae bacterium]|jgi:hypothetical protein|nr:PilZ domain-containing protein [Oscillospiraceae bacterium]
MNSNDRRVYKRDGNFTSDAKVSLDGVVWHDASVFDISAGGLKFVTNIIFDVGEDLWFNLELHETFLSSDSTKLKGTIRRHEDDQDGKFVYGVSFKDLCKKIQIGIDENIMFKEAMHKKKIEYSD